MREQNKKLKETQTNSKSIEEQTTSISNKCSSLETEKNKILEEKIELEACLKSTEEENKKLITQINEKQKEFNKIIQQKDVIIEEKNQKIIQFQKQINDLENENKLLLPFKAQTEVLMKNNNELVQYKNQNKELEKKYEEIIKEKKNYDDLVKKYHDNEKIFHNLKKENEELKKKYVEINQFKSVHENLKKENEELKKKFNEMSKYKHYNEILKIKYDSLKKQYDKIAEILPIIVGLDNIGATCYMNATLQCFSNVPELTDFFLNKFKYNPQDPNKKMTNEYYIVVKNLWNKNNKSFAPHAFKIALSEENPLFAGIAANDSKDLINFLLERFHQELNDIKDVNNENIMMNPNDQLFEDKMLQMFLNEMQLKYNSPISNLFYGVLETKSQCTNCKQVKFNFQIFSFLEFPLEQVNNYCFSIGKRNNFNGIGNPDIDLYECFDHYQLLLTMTGDNQLYCNNCNKSYDALYGTSLYSMPNYLIINLNRGKGAIYQCKVNFPEILQLYNYISFKDGNTVFQLQAVICHLGPSSMSGHFIAFCRHNKNNKWYKYNDSIVSYCENQFEYRTGMPYILFYKALK